MQEVRKLLNDNPNITNKEINRITGLSNMTITRILKNIYQKNVERREK
ncbi:winged helix-turn-helix transcriptional regulator [Staphylococcus aureus]|nr:winged helix-turn-helix transcriptional regulator [Staphylococcus aureus]QOY76329.1 winged helix-turn-helix transcriptional regulator [Staphylococcus aureus]